MELDPTLMTSVNLNHLPKALSPSTVTLGVKTSTYEFGRTQFSHSSKTLEISYSTIHADKETSALNCSGNVLPTYLLKSSHTRATNGVSGSKSAPCKKHSIEQLNYLTCWTLISKFQD